MVGASSGVGAGTAHLRPGATSAAFTVTLTLSSSFAVICLLVLLASIERPGDSRGAGARGRSRWWERLVALALLAAFGGGAVLLEHAHPHPRQFHLAAAATSSQGRTTGQSAVHFQVATAGVTLTVVLAAAALLLGLPAVRHRSLGRRRRAMWPGPLDARIAGLSDVAPGDAGLGSLLASVTIAGPDEESDPRRAIVAAYLAMTRAASQVAGERRRDETASEYLGRLLASPTLPASAARRLTGLFERARYSAERVDEETRALAISTLATLRSSLEAPA